MKHIYLSIAALLLLFSSNVSQTAAQTSSINIIPPKFETFANPGDTITERIRVRNLSDVTQTFFIQIEDFASAGEEGSVVLEEESSDKTYSLASWIEPSVSQITLLPNQEEVVNFSIYVPRDAEPGGHYASVLLQTSVPETIQGGATVTQRIGSLVLLRVSGNVIEEASIESFTVPTFSQSGPVTFNLRIKNAGNVHIRPKGTIIITDTFGKKIEELPLEGANVLPNAIRKMDSVWTKDRLLGQYTATLVATYGQQNQPLTAAAKFTVASYSSILLLTVGAVSLIVFLLSIISGRKRLAKAFKALTSS